MSTINIKCVNGDGCSIKIDLNKTILDLKKECQTKLKINSNEQKLIYKGKILSDDNNLNSAGIEDNHTVILIKSKTNSSQNNNSSANKPSSTNTPSSSNTFSSTNTSSFTNTPSSTNRPYTNPSTNPNQFNSFGTTNQMPFNSNPQNIMNDPALLSQTMQNPFVQEMMRNMMNNPDLMKNLMESNPMMRQMSTGNITPEMRNIMGNPELMRSVMGILNPNNSTTGTSPVPNQNLNPNPSQNINPNPSQNSPNPQNPQNRMNSLPNFSDFAQNLSQMGSIPSPSGNIPSQNNNSTTTTNQQETPKLTNEELEKKYKSQLDTLNSMGFTDNDKNIILLEQTNGNVQVVIDRLLGS